MQHAPDLQVAPVAHEQVIVVPVHVSVMFVQELVGQVTVGHSQVLPTHVFPPVQPPQLTLSPQVFFTVPHFPVQAAGGGGGGHFVQLWRIVPQPLETPVPGSHTPGLAQVRGVQPHVFVVVSHGSLVPHWAVPQLTDTPQPVSVPHLPVQSAAVGGTHATHWFVFASQICVVPPSLVVGQEPQLMATPHESMIVPH